MMTSYYRDDITGLPEMGVVAQKLWCDSGLKPNDVQRRTRPCHLGHRGADQRPDPGFELTD